MGITWAQFPTHLYSDFYVYQYATGISGAHALSENILSGKDGAVEKYLGFLKSGGSDLLNILKRAGVDLTTPEPVETTFGVFSRCVDRLEELTAKKMSGRHGEGEKNFSVSPSPTHLFSPSL